MQPTRQEAVWVQCVSAALAAAAGWAAYIVLTRQIGTLFSAQDGLCLSLMLAATIAIPVSCVLEPTGEWVALPAIAG